MTKKCKSCQTDIDSKAKKCPNCRADQRAWPARHPILTGIGVLILVSIILGAVGGSKGGSTSNSGSNTTSTTQPTKVAKVGDTVTDSNNMAFTVNGITTTSTLGNSYTAKTAQGQYQVINVTIKKDRKSVV